MSTSTALNLILTQQRAWAAGRGLTADATGYLPTVADNLFAWPSPGTLAEFAHGRGSEMLDTPTEPAKMRALHSSSALVVNVFDYWRERDPDAVARSLNIDPVNPVALSFEKQLRTGMRGTPPTLDLVLKAGECLWAVESKFTEPYQSHAHDAPFRESYFAKGRKRWAEVDLPRCQELAETMHCGSRRFARLDAAQLMKHALGVRHACPSGELLFLWYDVDTPEARELEREIAEFASAVDGALGFRALRYQDVLPRLLGEEAACREYRGYTSERYL